MHMEFYHPSIIDIIPMGETLRLFLEMNNEKTIVKRPMHIIYEGHIPMAAYFLICGELEMRYRNRLVRSIQEPNLIIGGRELLNNKSFPFSVVAMPASEIYILSRTSLQEAFQAGYLKQLQAQPFRRPELRQ